MKILKLTTLIIATITLINGCGINDIGVTSTENLTIDDNISSGNTTISNITQQDDNSTQLTDNINNDPIVDNTPIVIHDGTDSSYTTTNNDPFYNDQTTSSDQTASSNSSSSNIIIDPNACSSEYNFIEDDNNEPQGVTENGIKFTSKLADASTRLIFYYQKQTDDNTLNGYLGDFYDENGNLIFSLSINEAYYGTGYFYIRNGSTGKCYRGKFPDNGFVPPNKIVTEVSQN